MTQEQKFWRALKRALGPASHRWHRVESRATGSYIPDCLVDLGPVRVWVELKVSAPISDPDRTKVRAPSLTEGQRVTLASWYRSGKDAYLMIQCGAEVLLLTGHDAAHLIGTATLQELRGVAVAKWPTCSRVDARELFEALRQQVEGEGYCAGHADYGTLVDTKR